MQALSSLLLGHAENMQVDVEILDVTDAEARILLLSMDPLAALAQTHAETHARLRAQVHTASEALSALWQASAKAASCGSSEKTESGRVYRIAGKKPASDRVKAKGEPSHA